MRWRSAARANGARLAALLAMAGLTLTALGDLTSGGAALPASAEGLEPESCAGDEQISFAPAGPLAGEELLISVTSSRQHRGVWLQGT